MNCETIIFIAKDKNGVSCPFHIDAAVAAVVVAAYRSGEIPMTRRRNLCCNNYKINVKLFIFHEFKRGRGKQKHCRPQQGRHW
jgi:hypothetical protein